MTSSYEIRQSIFKKIIKKLFSFFGYEIKKKNNFNDRFGDRIVELNEFDKKNIDLALKFALANKENLWSIIQSIKYIYDNKIEGDFVECGVFKGGSLGLIAKYAENYKINSKIIGYDTFEDGFLQNNYSEYDLSYKTNKPIKYENNKNFFPTINEVKNNLNSFNLNENYFPILIKGDILKILNEDQNIPKKISFLRLDTDIYKTTKLQLEVLYPKLEKGGILHIDDYGLCNGVQKAVDEYFSNSKIWLHRVDLSCRLMIKN